MPRRKPVSLTPAEVLAQLAAAQEDFYCQGHRAARPDLAVWLAGEKLPRCGVHGHRMTWHGHIPVRTRRRPWRAWVEVRNRRRARRLFAGRGGMSVL